MWSTRSSSSKTFSCVSYSFVCSKCLTSSAIREASSSTSSSVGIGSGMRGAWLNGVRFGYFANCQLAGHPQNFREQSVGAAGAGVDLARDDAVAGVDVRGARHAGIEAADGAQDVDPFEIFRVIESLQQRCVQDRFFIRTRVIPGIARRCVDRGRRDDLIVGHVSVLKLEMMSEPAAARAPKANADLITFLRNFKRR